jgi:HAD superfamily hydrolase (TIGR01509 family)
MPNKTHTNMIKLLIFDFDGVIADCKEIHYQSLNKALELVSPNFTITESEHLTIFDGLSTKKKLNMLATLKGLPASKHTEIYNNKQSFTTQLLHQHLVHDTRLFNIISQLKSEGYVVYMASNAIRETIETGLNLLGLLPLFDKIYSNEDISNQKPHPQIYLKCMVDAGVAPDETVIIEDSKHGRAAAVASGAHVCGVDNSLDVSYEKIHKTIDSVTDHTIKWSGGDVNIVIPMAGLGSRFQQMGYKLPKPLIDVNGKPMIQRVVESLNINGRFIFIVKGEHCEQYNIDIMLKMFLPNCEVVKVWGPQGGATRSVLEAKHLFDNSDHLVIANSDQMVEWDSGDFMYHMIAKNVEGGILVFNDTNPKWSFAKINELGHVTEVAEKNPISDIATVGIYYYKRGSDFVKYAEQMISKNIKTNNEFYVCPIFNEYIGDGGENRSLLHQKNDWFRNP